MHDHLLACLGRLKEFLLVSQFHVAAMTVQHVFLLLLLGLNHSRLPLFSELLKIVLVHVLQLLDFSVQLLLLFAQHLG